MILEILFTLASAASGTLIYKKMGGFEQIRARVVAALPAPGESKALPEPERVLPYSVKLMHNARHMGDILSSITHIMMKEQNPLWNRYTSVAARFNLMLNSHYDEDAFVHLTQEKRKFFSVFIPQVLSSIDFDDYKKARDKSRYMEVFQQIHDYCLEIVVYYEEYQVKKQDSKLLDIQQAISASRDQALPAPVEDASSPLLLDSQPVLTIEHLRQSSLDISFHQSDYGLNIRIQPNLPVPENVYFDQLISYLNELFEHRENVTFVYSFYGQETSLSYALTNSSFNPRTQSFEIIRAPVSYMLSDYLSHTPIDGRVIMDMVIVVHDGTNKIEFYRKPR